MGLSMGGCLALRMAELRGYGDQRAGAGEPIAGRRHQAVRCWRRVLKLVVPSLKGIGSDIKKEGVTRAGYDRVPVRAAATLPALWRVTQQRLG